MNCEKCRQELNENYMICRNCGEPRKPLETRELVMWKAAQAENERLEVEAKEIEEANKVIKAIELYCNTFNKCDQNHYDGYCKGMIVGRKETAEEVLKIIAGKSMWLKEVEGK